MRTQTLLLTCLLVACGSKAKPADTTTASTAEEGPSTSKVYDFAEDTLDAAAAPAEPARPEFDKVTIRAGMRGATAKFLACAATETASVSVMTKFVLDPKGIVVSAEATGGADATNTCIGDVVKALTFGTPGVVVSVSYPIKIVK